LCFDLWFNRKANYGQKEAQSTLNCELPVYLSSSHDWRETTRHQLSYDEMRKAKLTISTRTG